eukprot:PhM_4_TR12729/c0_g2_i1/m.97903
MLRRSFRWLCAAEAEWSDVDVCYMLYEKTVQSVGVSVEFMSTLYERKHGKQPLTLCEDYAGTANHAIEWVRRDPKCTAIAVDTDPRGLGYSMRRVLRNKILDVNSRRQKLDFLVQDVLHVEHAPVNCVCALNFSWMCMHTKDQLRRYFESVLRRTTDERLLVIDLFGGPSTKQVGDWYKEHDGYTYMWRHTNYNPITDVLSCSAAFVLPPDENDPEDEGKPTFLTLDAFEYEWRCWKAGQVTEILKEAGFGTVEWWQCGDGSRRMPSQPQQQEQQVGTEVRLLKTLPTTPAWTMMLAAS